MEGLTIEDGLANRLQEHEIFLLAVGSFAVNYRKKATADGVIALFFLYGKMAVLAACYYMDRKVFGWYFVCVASAFDSLLPLACSRRVSIAVTDTHDTRALSSSVRRSWTAQVRRTAEHHPTQPGVVRAAREARRR